MPRPLGAALLWVLAAQSAALLIYEGATLIGSVLRPLIANPNALQTDFHYYYDAAVRFNANAFQLYSATDDVIAGFAYPPPAILPFAWLARWPLGTALLALTIASYLVMVVTARHWVGWLKRQGYRCDRRTTIAVTLVVLASGPVYMNAIFGQVNAFVLASAVGFISLAPTAVLAAAVLLAAGTWLKVYPLLIAAIGLWDRTTRRALRWSVAAAAAIGLIVGLAFVPLPNFVTFFFEVLPARADQTAIHITNQSLVAFLERFRYPSAQFVSWTGEQAVTVGVPVRLWNVLFAVGAIGLMWMRSHDGIRHRALNAATLMALVAVVAPLGWGHTYVMVLPLVMLQLLAMRDARPALAAVIFVCIEALMIPAGRRWTFLEASPDWMLNLIYSRYLLATLVLAAIPSVALGRTTEPNATSSP
jgi:alpha-1,2-mannosyltransferase